MNELEISTKDSKTTEAIMNVVEELQLANEDIVVKQTNTLGFPDEDGLRNNEMCFYHVEKLAYDEEYPHREAFENVLTSLDNKAFNFVYILTGNQNGIDLNIGVVQNHNENIPELGKKLSATNYGEIIANVFEGNFSGSRLKKLTGNKLLEEIITNTEKYKNAGVILGVPSINEQKDSKYDFQGMDRLINSMLGLEWRIVIVCEPVDKNEIQLIRENIFAIYNQLVASAKASVQKSQNASEGISIGESKSKATSAGFSQSKQSGRSYTPKEGGTGHSSSESQSESGSVSNTQGNSNTKTINKGISESITLEIANKKVQEVIKYIDDELLKRLQLGFSKGLFKTAVYYMAKEPTHANRLKVAITSLFQGNKSMYSPMFSRKLKLESSHNLLCNYQCAYEEQNDVEEKIMRLLSRPFYNSNSGLSTLLTTSEVSLLAGLPQKEIPGLPMTEEVNFGLNENDIVEQEKIELGYLLQKGRELKTIPFNLSKKTLKKHTFIAGVTGSGKTTTCHKLLTEADVPFLVIEPAKTEYRILTHSNNIKDVMIFTLGNEVVAPFRINPFELEKGEVISSHIDLVKATFTSAFPMEASMPQILEEAIYKCYEVKGWNFDTNTNDIYGDCAFDGKVDSFPILSELLEMLKSVVETKGFSERLQGDYIGSLVSRLSNLIVGSKGKMLNCSHSTDFDYISKHNVIIELEDLKSSEDKALIMGFIISKLSAVIKQNYKTNKDYRHLTLIEEAHRLLSKVEYGDSGAKKAAVETFTDLLAEIRKYGEGMVIVDQIPNKLAPEVLKNTNTKIIHKILAKDDKEAVGDTMLMDDKQKKYLSALSVGDAIVFTESTDKPVHIHVTQVADTDEEEVDDEEVIKLYEENMTHFPNVYLENAVTSCISVMNKVTKHLSKIEIDKESFMTLREMVANIKTVCNVETKDVWMALIMRWEQLNGKGISSANNKEERQKFLFEFFINKFMKENMQENDISETLVKYLSI